MLLVPVAHSLPHQPPQEMAAAGILPAQRMFLALSNVLCSSHHDGSDTRISLSSWAAFLTAFCFIDFSKPLQGTGRTSDRAFPIWWVIFLAPQTLQGKILLTASWISSFHLSLFLQSSSDREFLIHTGRALGAGAALGASCTSVAHGLPCWGATPPLKHHLPPSALQGAQAPESQIHNSGAFWSCNSTFCSFNGILGLKWWWNWGVSPFITGNNCNKINATSPGCAGKTSHLDIPLVYYWCLLLRIIKHGYAANARWCWTSWHRVSPSNYTQSFGFHSSSAIILFRRILTHSRHKTLHLR